MATPDRLTLKAIRESLRVNRSGTLLWRKSTPRTQAGARAGWLSEYGYYRVTVGGKTVMAHAIVWYLGYGKWPGSQMDHIDGCRTNNRLTNLRLATNSQNAQNRKTAAMGSRSGMLGVSPNHTKWRATISIKGKQIFIGNFETPEDARAAYLAHKPSVHPFYANP